MNPYSTISEETARQDNIFHMREELRGLLKTALDSVILSASRYEDEMEVGAMLEFNGDIRDLKDQLEGLVVPG